jgi:hypothetical protein
MIKFLSIPNPDKLLSIVDGSRGNVYLRLPDGNQCDLKREPLARQLLRTMVPGKDGVQLSLSNPDDIPAFLRYMVETPR